MSGFVIQYVRVAARYPVRPPIPFEERMKRAVTAADDNTLINVRARRWGEGAAGPTRMHALRENLLAAGI